MHAAAKPFGGRKEDIMIRIIINGCNGRMGQAIARACTERPEVLIVAGIDIAINPNAPFPTYDSPEKVIEEADVIIDFSHPSSLTGILAFAVNRRLPIVVSTTGLTESQRAELSAASAKTAVLRSANMSLGVNLLIDLVQTAARTLYERYDIEIIEKHHNQKVDAPSGTALAIADAVNEAIEPVHMKYVYDRQPISQKRTREEIGIHAVRGGTIAGEHAVLFAGKDEILELKHTALSRDIFAEGSLTAAQWLAGKAPGMYSMRDLFAAAE